MKYEVTLWLDGKHAERHTFDLPYGCKQWYISVGSVSAFSRRENKKLYDYASKHKTYSIPGKRASVRFADDEEATRKILTDAGVDPRELELPTFHHESVWDFYKAIGYDYKRKKYD